MEERNDMDGKIQTAADRLYEKIEALLQEEAALRQGDLSPRKAPLLAAVDGRCGAGKTTLAAWLQKKSGWDVLHMDHFFLRPEQRTKERLSTPGGNVDYERFLEEVLLPLKRGEEEIFYRPYDCHRQEMADPVLIRPGKVCLVEGSYSCHPALWDKYDLHVFLTIDAQEQMRRITRRNGADSAKVFRERWILLEERYFAAYRIEERCGLRLEMGAEG
ncbi:MAG: uridine kinase [Blautia sp.]|nr:uridine kinase [Blautia sp.]MCM1199777.1 hypothetical protein [Bacteroides fragilis]